MHAWIHSLNLELPLVLAPLSGGPGTPELVAAVSSAGGLGSLGAAYLTPEQLDAAGQKIRTLTSKPFAVNLFAGGYGAPRPPHPEPALEWLAVFHKELGLAAPLLDLECADPFDKQLHQVLKMQPAVLSFTFGIPTRQQLAMVRQRSIAAVGTATNLSEIHLLVEAGVDAIVLQGSEAGGHRGTFAGDLSDSLVPLRELLDQAKKATALPLIASGGLMDGRDVVDVLSRGACAASLGTAFLACPESGASLAYKQALLAAQGDPTTVTRAFSGRYGRGLRNRFVEELERRPELILDFPWQNSLTRPLRTEAARQGKAEFLSLWAGQAVARCQAIPAAELVAQIATSL